jgi:hypothetical protein
MIMTQLRQWSAMFIVALALAVLLNRFAGPGTETAEADSPKTLWLGPSNFVPGSEYTRWRLYGHFITGDGYFYAPVMLPPGKKITGMTVDYLDFAFSDDLCARLLVDPAGSVSSTSKANGCSTSYDPLARSLAFPVSPSYKVAATDTLYVWVLLEGNTDDLQLYSVGIQYK